MPVTSNILRAKVPAINTMSASNQINLPQKLKLDHLFGVLLKSTKVFILYPPGGPSYWLFYDHFMIIFQTWLYPNDECHLKASLTFLQDVQGFHTVRKHYYTQRFYRDNRSYISKIWKVVTQPVKIIHTLEPIKPKI